MPSVLKILEPKPPGTLRATLGLLRDCLPVLLVNHKALVGQFVTFLRLVVGAFATLREATVKLRHVSPVCPSVLLEQPGPHWTDIHAI